MKYISRYPGVKPFETDEQHLFFGRSNDIQALYDLVGVEKTVLLYSKSGLGKSSLINAGLIPRLENAPNIKYNYYTIRLGAFSKENSISPRQKIIELIRKTAAESQLNSFPELSENSLAYWLKSLQINDPVKINVLIFDQFEELFTYPDEQVEELKNDLHELLYSKTSAHFREQIPILLEKYPEAFSDEQLNTLSSAVNIRLLFVIRSDYLSMLNRLTDYLPNLQRTFYELQPLEIKEAARAITSPARIEGEFPCPKFEFSNEAVDKILAALSDNGKQSIETFQLQIVCQHAESLILKNQPKNSIAPDDLGDIRDIHQSFYNNLMEDLSTKNEEEKQQLRILLEEQFIYEPEQRRLQVLKGIILKKISESTLAALEKTHLIRSEPYQDSFTYELSHDTLVEPILKSYRLRKELQERKDLEYKKLEEIRVIRDRAIKQRKIIIVVSLAAIFSIGMAIFGFVQWDKSKSALKEVERSKANIVKEKNKAEEAVRQFEAADRKRREVEVNTLINDARSFEMYGETQDALKAIEKALKIDSANLQAIELLHKYSNRK
jgi:hypothetical protein